MEFTRDRETESVIPSRVILGDYKFGRKVAGIECEHRTVRARGTAALAAAAPDRWLFV